MAGNTDVGSLLVTLHDLRIINYNMVCTSALLVYDIILTHGQEFKYLWRSPRALAKVAYFFTRYFAVIFMILESIAYIKMFLPLNVSELCLHLFHLEIWGITMFILLVDVLIVMRVFVLYSRNTRVGVFLFAVWITEVVTIVVLVIFAVKEEALFPAPVQPGLIPSCLNLTPPKYKYALSCWGICSFFQVVYITMTLVKMREFLRGFGFSMSPILGVLFRDGLAYFLIIFSANMVNLMFDKLALQQLATIGGSWLITVASITGCRLVLNVRSAAKTPLAPQTAPPNVSGGGVNSERREEGGNRDASTQSALDA
ncbi:hypothetical protein JB92DRAFT_2867736 [Gautieria morchelliformis]|nr:hypothetical protein JB92DRAFT_2867736 [Gautieria morchelliformis]